MVWESWSVRLSGCRPAPNGRSCSSRLNSASFADGRRDANVTEAPRAPGERACAGEPAYGFGCGPPCSSAPAETAPFTSRAPLQPLLPQPPQKKADNHTSTQQDRGAPHHSTRCPATERRKKTKSCSRSAPLPPPVRSSQRARFSEGRRTWEKRQQPQQLQQHTPATPAFPPSQTPFSAMAPTPSHSERRKRLRTNRLARPSTNAGTARPIPAPSTTSISTAFTSSISGRSGNLGLPRPT